MIEKFSTKTRAKIFCLRFYRYVCCWKSHQVEKHRVHDATHFYGRHAVPHRRLGKGGIEEDAGGVQLFEHSCPQLTTFLDVIFLFGWPDHAACGVESEEVQSVERIFRLSDYRFSQLAPQFFWLLQGESKTKKFRAIKALCATSIDTVSSRVTIFQLTEKRNVK